MNFNEEKYDSTLFLDRKLPDAFILAQMNKIKKSNAKILDKKITKAKQEFKRRLKDNLVYAAVQKTENQYFKQGLYEEAVRLNNEYLEKILNDETFDIDIDILTEEEKKVAAINAQEEIHKEILKHERIHSKFSKINILFDVSNLGLGQKDIDYAMQFLRLLKNNNIEFTFALQMLNKNTLMNQGIPTMLTEDQIQKIKTFEARLVDVELVENVCIQEGLGCPAFTIKDIENVNLFVHKVVEKIHKLNLSPFETVIYLHDFCGKFFYNQKIKEDKAMSRVLAGVLKSGNIVCVGYSVMFKSIIDALNNPHIKAFLNKAVWEKFSGGHANNLIFIEDAKYQIKGAYIEDATFDAKIANVKHNCLTHCLYPIHNIKNQSFYYSGFAKIQEYYSLKNHMPKIVRLVQNTKVFKKLCELEFELSTLPYRGKPIDFEKYFKAYYEVLLKKGCKPDVAQRLAQEKINYSIAYANKNYKNGKKNTFIQEKDEDFMKKYAQGRQKMTNLIIEDEKDVAGRINNAKIIERILK